MSVGKVFEYVLVVGLWAAFVFLYRQSSFFGPLQERDNVRVIGPLSRLLGRT